MWANLHDMIVDRKRNMAVAAGCFLFLMVWLCFWLFIASRDSGRTVLTTEVKGKQHSEVRYNNEQRYRPYIPLVVLGVYGGFVGCVVSILVRRKLWDQRFLFRLRLFAVPWRSLLPATFNFRT